MTERSDLIEKLAQDAEIAREKLADDAPIRTDENPLPRIDVLCRLNASIHNPPATVTVYFVPDRRTVQATGLQAYLDTLKAPSRPAVLAARILADLSNELVPRFVQVRVECGNEGDSVLVEDRRPKWDNPAILSRLPDF